MSCEFKFLEAQQLSPNADDCSGSASCCPKTELPLPSGSGRGHVLVVDDDRITRKYFQLVLETEGWRVTAVESGPKAELLYYGETAPSLDCALIDHYMPGITGLELLAWLRECDPSLASILVTATGDQALVENALANGACGFLNKPVCRGELLREVGRAMLETRHRRHLTQLALDVKRVGLKQRMIVRSGVASSSGVALAHFPFHEAGGDLLVRYALPNGETLILAADVSGHDLESAFLAAHLQGMVRGMLQRAVPAEEILEFFNTFLLEEWGTHVPGSETPTVRASVSLAALHIQPSLRQMIVFANGNPLPLLSDMHGRTSLIGLQGCPLGWFEGPVVRPFSYPFDEGASVRVWTDGLEDLAEKMGIDPLAVAFALHRVTVSGSSPSWLEQSSDDMLTAAISLSPGSPPGWEPIYFELYSRGAMSRIDAWQARWEKSLSFALSEITEEALFNVLLVAREALLNGLSHGCTSDTQTVSFHLAFHSDQGKIRIIVSDPGKGHSQPVGAARRESSRSTWHRGLDLVSLGEVTLHRGGAEMWIDLDL